MGTDLVQFARAGARVTGVDLTPQAVTITRQRLNLYGLHGEARLADAESLPFADATFDRVYSFGVLHHTPDTARAIGEVHRVLRPGGKVLVMLYHRNSVQYRLGVLVFRRAGFALLRKGIPPRTLARLGGYRPEILEGYARYLAGRPPLSQAELVALSTDGPGNPLSKVFSRTEARMLFRGFSKVSVEVRYLTRNCIPLLARLIPDPLYGWLGRRWGADLYIQATK
jgi:SAM-dependent methyltransferase